MFSAAPRPPLASAGQKEGDRQGAGLARSGARRTGSGLSGEKEGSWGQGRGEERAGRDGGEGTEEGRAAGKGRGRRGAGPGRARGGAAGGAVSARRRAECSGPRPGHVRTRGRGPRPPRSGPQHRPPRPGSPRGRGYGAGGRGRGPGRQESGPRWGGGHLTPNLHARRGDLVPPPSRPGRGPGRAARKVPAGAGAGADSRGGLSRVRVGPKFWIHLEQRGDGSGVGWVEVLQGGRGWRGRPGLGCALEPTRAGEAGARSERGSSLGPEVSWKEEAPLSPRPRFCDTLRLGLWSSQCMTELGPGRTFRTLCRAPPRGCREHRLGGEQARSGPLRDRTGPEPALGLVGAGHWSLSRDPWGP